MAIRHTYSTQVVSILTRKRELKKDGRSSVVPDVQKIDISYYESRFWTEFWVSTALEFDVAKLKLNYLSKSLPMYHTARTPKSMDLGVLAYWQPLFKRKKEPNIRARMKTPFGAKQIMRSHKVNRYYELMPFSM
jgi:hypothetical protein